jgi:2-polyprenyl-3-methyl-5-hydroxy-6-metoxy-1,4-benzoquinol methylase
LDVTTVAAVDPKPRSDGDADTAGAAYTERLVGLQTVWWKKILPVQAPYRFNIRRLPLGRTLDVGCGLGRNLQHLDGNGVGIDHNPDFVAYCRRIGLTAYTPETFTESPDAVPGGFDSMILAHVIEHLDAVVTDEIFTRYLTYVKKGGHVHLITPQEVGYRSDPTHVRFVDFEALRELVGAHKLTLVKSYSFPFPRFVGHAFIYNEFNVLARKDW